MKYLTFIFLALFWPQQGYSKAICPVDKTLKECCLADPGGAHYTMSECQTLCSGKCQMGYYADCFLCNDTAIVTNPPLDDPGTPSKPVSGTISSCPPGTKLSTDQCCCNNN